MTWGQDDINARQDRIDENNRGKALQQQEELEKEIERAMTKFKPGDKVTYVPAYGKPEPGVVKLVPDDEHVFVVYHCDNQWHRYQDYTAARTERNDLVRGWRF